MTAATSKRRLVPGIYMEHKRVAKDLGVSAETDHILTGNGRGLTSELRGARNLHDPDMMFPI